MNIVTFKKKIMKLSSDTYIVPTVKLDSFTWNLRVDMYKNRHHLCNSVKVQDSLSNR